MIFAAAGIGRVMYVYVKKFLLRFCANQLAVGSDAHDVVCLDVKANGNQNHCGGQTCFSSSKLQNWPFSLAFGVGCGCWICLRCSNDGGSYGGNGRATSPRFRV